MHRTSIGRLLLVVPLLAAGLALGAPSPAAAAFACDTEPGFLSGITIKDSLVVEAGDFCHLENATVRGGVTVHPGGVFLATNTEIRGGLVATDPDQVILQISTVVRGTVTISHNVFAATVKGILLNVIDGDLICEGNTDAGGNVLTTLTVADNTVDGVTTGQCIP